MAMKVIIAGSRHIKDYQLVSQIISNTISKHNIEVTEVVSGGAPGIDTFGEQWALENGIPVTPFEAAWDDLTVPNALIRTNKYGKEYNARAGFSRNEQMGDYGDILLAIWDGKSRGTKHMISVALERNLPTYQYIIGG